jgi:hypothetical protein
MTTYEGMEVVLHAFLTLALRLSRFAPAEKPLVPFGLVEGWGWGHRTPREIEICFAPVWN